MVLGLNKSLILISSALIASCSSPSTDHYTNTSNEASISSKALYTLHCEACHGVDGKKGISGAADLSVSKINSKEIKYTILNGNEKGMMPYKEIITNPAEIDSLVSYVQTLRKK
jgi:cytochrome c6